MGRRRSVPPPPREEERFTGYRQTDSRPARGDARGKGNSATEVGALPDLAAARALYIIESIIGFARRNVNNPQ